MCFTFVVFFRSTSRTSEDEVTHQLVTLLCEFMSNPSNDNEFGRTQEYVISQIKHHVGLQMGYNVTAIGEFTGSPRRLRCSDWLIFVFTSRQRRASVIDKR